MWSNAGIKELVRHVIVLTGPAWLPEGMRRLTLALIGNALSKLAYGRITDHQR